MEPSEDQQPTVPHDVAYYFIGYLRETIELSGQISRRDWDNAVDAAHRFKRSLDEERNRPEGRL